MNKQLINKYKPEFDHWLNEGKLLYKHTNSNAWRNDEPWSYSPDYVTAIIINDEYLEFRKALAEDKIIQIYDIIEQHSSDRIFDKFGWRDFKSFTSSSLFSKTPDLYRIKPDEPKFKVGDFVRYIHATPLRALEINNINGNRYYFTNSEMSCLEHELEPWSPVKDEWCWFYDSKSGKSSPLAKFKQMSRQFFESEEIGIYDYCEPFLNSLPSYLKDN